MNEEKYFENDLNERERKVLASIIRYPLSSDIEIASRVGIKHSTFATIKKRLQIKNYYTRIYFPNFLEFGAEIISIHNYQLSKLSAQNFPISSPNTIIKEFESLKDFPNLLFSVIENNIISIMSCYHDFSQLENDLGKFDSFSLQSGLNLSTHSEIHFPIRFAEFPRFFDYSRSISKYLQVDLETDQFNPVFLPINDLKINITSLGYDILYSLLEEPGRTPKVVSEIIGKPRTTVTRWLRRFITSGLITPKIIPNVRKLGYEIVSISHYSVISTKTSILHESINIIDKELSPFILIRSEFDIVFTSLYNSFEAYQETEAKFVSEMNKAGISFTVESHYLLSLPHTTSTLDFMRNFAPLVSQLSGK